MKYRGILIDVYVQGRFYRQLCYKKRGFPLLADGRRIEAFDTADLEKFVEEKCPSLVGQEYNLEISKQKVFNN